MAYGLKKLKKDLQSLRPEISTYHFDTLIVGQDISCFMALSEELKKDPQASVKILCERNWIMKDLFDYWNNFPSLVRNDVVKEELSSKYPHVHFALQDKDPVFYKDQDFRSFKSRFKPEAMVGLEENFTTIAYQYQIEDFFESSFLEKFEEILKSSQVNQKVMSIKKENDIWEIELFDGSTMFVKNLIWGDIPRHFLNAFSQKDQIKEEVQENLLRVMGSPVMCVSYILSKPLHDGNQTVFIPQSQTHEWGHFVADFNLLGDGTQQMKCFFYIDIELDAEELSKKVRLLKRNFSRVYENFERFITAESISFRSDFFVSGGISMDEIIENKKLPHFIDSFFKRSFDKHENIFINQDIDFEGSGLQE